jgi:hypothetical protein
VAGLAEAVVALAAALVVAMIVAAAAAARAAAAGGVVAVACQPAAAAAASVAAVEAFKEVAAAAAPIGVAAVADAAGCAAVAAAVAAEADIAAVAVAACSLAVTLEPLAPRTPNPHRNPYSPHRSFFYHDASHSNHCACLSHSAAGDAAEFMYSAFGDVKLYNSTAPDWYKTSSEYLPECQDNCGSGGMLSLQPELRRLPHIDVGQPPFRSHVAPSRSIWKNWSQYLLGLAAFPSHPSLDGSPMKIWASLRFRYTRKNSRRQI